jgi:hypothetical protein
MSRYKVVNCKNRETLITGLSAMEAQSHVDALLAAFPTHKFAVGRDFSL